MTNQPPKDVLVKLWKESPPVAAHFPIKLKGFQWDSVSAQCAGCGSVITGPNLRGTMDRSWGNVAVIEGLGTCSCKTATYFKVRLYDDGRMMVLLDKWTERRGNTDPFWLRWLKKLIP